MNLKEKDKVKVVWDLTGPIGTIVKAGPEVSEVWFKEDKRLRYLTNEHLILQKD